MMSYIFAAILSNLSFAITDNLSGILSKRNKPLQISLWSALVSILVFAIPAFTIFYSEFSKLTFGNTAAIVGLALLVNMGFFCFITSMNKGSVTLGGVISTSYPALATILAVIFFDEQITLFQTVAIALVIIGVSMSMVNGRLNDATKDFKSAGTIFALAALLLWGFYSAFIRIPIEQVGWFVPDYIVSIVGVILFFGIAIISKNKSAFGRPKLFGLLVASSLLTFVASLLLNYAISKGQTSIVVPIAGSSPAVFVIIAYFVFHEKLNKKQWSGIVMTVIGIICLSLLSS